MAELSPAARSLWGAFNFDIGTHLGPDEYEEFRVNLAAALLALADHQPQPWIGHEPVDQWFPDDQTRRQLRQFATELENLND